LIEGLEEPFANGQDRDQEAVEMAKVERFLFTRAKSDFHMTPEESEKFASEVLTASKGAPPGSQIDIFFDMQTKTLRVAPPNRRFK
jgi:hypothetical protein